MAQAIGTPGRAAQQCEQNAGRFPRLAACRIQIGAQSGGSRLEFIEDEIVAGMGQQAREVTSGQGANLLWPGLLRRLDRRSPGYGLNQ